MRGVRGLGCPDAPSAAMEPIVDEPRPRAPMRRMVAVSVLAGVCGAAALVSSKLSPHTSAAMSALDQIAVDGSSSSSDGVVIKAYASALSPDCRRHALELDKYMLSDSGVLDAVEVEVGFFGGAREIDAYGAKVAEVNKYHLCAQKELNQTTSEWWSFSTCLFGLQGCLSYSVAGKVDCVEAASGLDDDVGVMMGDDGFSTGSCSCTLQGVVDYCARTHTSTSFQELDECKKSDKAAKLFNASDAAAELQNMGQTTWVTVNDVLYSTSGHESKPTLEVWADEVLAATCVDLTEQAITPEEISALPTKCNVVDDDDGADDDDAATSTADDDADDDASD